MSATPGGYVIALDGERVDRTDAHSPGSDVKHWAFTSVLQDGRGRIPLLQRHQSKPFGWEYDVGVASHYASADRDPDVVVERHDEEIGVRPETLERVGTFDYRSVSKRGMVENERCDLYVGRIDHTRFDLERVDAGEITDIAWAPGSTVSDRLEDEVEETGRVSPYLDVELGAAGRGDTVLIPPWATVAVLLADGKEDHLGDISDVEDWTIHGDR